MYVLFNNKREDSYDIILNALNNILINDKMKQKK